MCESARSLSYSLFITLTPVHLSFTHTHTHTQQLELDFNEKQTVRLFKSQWEVCQQLAINFVGSLFVWQAEMFFCLTYKKPLSDKRQYSHIHTQKYECTQTCGTMFLTYIKTSTQREKCTICFTPQQQQAHWKTLISFRVTQLRSKGVKRTQIKALWQKEAQPSLTS